MLIISKLIQTEQHNSINSPILNSNNNVKGKAQRIKARAFSVILLRHLLFHLNKDLDLSYKVMLMWHVVLIINQMEPTKIDAWAKATLSCTEYKKIKKIMLTLSTFKSTL